jgi:8-oxo-dGTP pyrophosphatase MutT (NUDIX family)
MDKSKLYKNTISACGCLFYKIVNNKLKLLLISYSDPKWPKLDDFGGTIDEDDDNIIDAIVRETLEESNYKIKERSLRKKL